MRKHYIILPIILTLFSLLFAGAPDTLWTRTYGGDSVDIGYYVQQTSDGGFIIAGESNSFGVGDKDVYLVRTDSNGDTLWTNTYSGVRGNSVQQKSDGGFIIASSTSFGLSRYCYLINTNPNGDTLWTKMYGGTAFDIPEAALSVQQTGDGGFIFVGTHNNDAYLVLTDVNGDTLWTKSYGDSLSHAGHSIQHVNDSGFIICGSSLYNRGDVYLIRTDSNGDTLWTNTYGGSLQEAGYSVQQTNNGDFIITGWTVSYGAGEQDVYLIRTDSNGDTLWTKTYGGINYDQGYSVLQLSDGGFIIAGSTMSFGAGRSDVYIIRTDSIGDTLWTKTCGGMESENARSIQQTRDGGFIIAGVTSSFGAGGNDVYLIRLNKDTTSIQEEIPSNFLNPNNFIISYNNGNISIRYTIPYSSSVKLEAYDIKGKLVKVIIDKFMQKGSYSVNWDSKRFGSGVYFLKLIANGSAVTKKFTIIK